MARRQLGTSPAGASTSTDAATVGYVQVALDPLLPAIAPAWSATAAYNTNDTVTAGGQLYTCTNPVTAPIGAGTVIGSATYTSDLASDRHLLLPAGCVAGDQAMLMIAASSTGTFTVAFPDAGAYAGSYYAAGTGAKFVAAFEIYILTATDITNGYILIPTQPAATGRYTALAFVLRNCTVIGGLVPTGTTTVSANTPLLNSGMGVTPVIYFSVFAGYMATGSSASGYSVFVGGASAAITAQAVIPDLNQGNLGIAAAWEPGVGSWSIQRAFGFSGNVPGTAYQARWTHAVSMGAAGTPNPAPLTDLAHWAPIVGQSVTAIAGQAMVRDSAGRSQVVDPAVAADVATKNYVDSRNVPVAWNPNTLYAIGDAVNYNGMIYTCNAAITQPSGASFIVGSSAYSTDTANTNRLLLPAGAQAGDVAVWVIMTTNNSGAGGTMFPGGQNYADGWTFGAITTGIYPTGGYRLYTLTAADITAGYLDLSSAAGPAGKMASVAVVLRGVTATLVNGASNHLASTATTAFSLSAPYPYYVFSLLAALRAGSAGPGTLTVAGTTGVRFAESLYPISSTNLVAAIAWETVASGTTTTARTFSVANPVVSTSYAWKGAEALAAVTATVPGTTPDQDSAHWSALVAPVIPYYEEISTAAFGAITGSTWTNLCVGASRVSSGAVGTTRWNLATGVWTNTVAGLYSVTVEVNGALASNTVAAGATAYMSVDLTPTLAGATFYARDDRAVLGIPAWAVAMSAELYLPAGATLLAAGYIAGNTAPTFTVLTTGTHRVTVRCIQAY